MSSFRSRSFLARVELSSLLSSYWPSRLQVLGPQLSVSVFLWIFFRFRICYRVPFFNDDKSFTDGGSRGHVPRSLTLVRLHPAPADFLIANPRLETHLSHRKQTSAHRSNSEFSQVFPPISRNPFLSRIRSAIRAIAGSLSGRYRFVLVSLRCLLLRRFVRMRRFRRVTRAPVRPLVAPWLNPWICAAMTACSK